MLAYRFCDDLPEFFHPDDIGKKEIGDHKTHQVKHHMFEGLADDLVAVPGSMSHSALLCRIPFNEIFQLAEEHFHEYGLRTNPAAEQAPESGGEQHDENNECDHREAENEEILGPEYHAEQDEFRLHYIE